VSLRSKLFESGFDASIKTQGAGALRKIMAKRGGQYTFTRAASAGCAPN